MSGLGEFLLHSGLFEEIRHVGVVVEVADTLGTDNVFRPFLCYIIVEFIDVKGFACEIYESADAILLSFTLPMMVMMVVMVMPVLVLVIIVVMMVMMLMLVLVVVVFVLVIIVVMVVMVLVFVVIILIHLDSGNRKTGG